MKISFIYIKNFRSIKELTLKPNQICALVGENNAGKSNILRAINFLFGETYPVNISTEDINDNDISKEVIIKIGLELSEEEQSEINEYRGYRSAGKIIGVCFTKLADDTKGQFRLINDQKNEEYCKNEIRELIGITYVGSNRDIDYQLSYTSKFTFLSKLANRFEKELNKVNEQLKIKEELQKKFSEIEKEFRKVEPFQNFEDSLQSYFESHLPSSSESRFDIKVDFKAYNPVKFFRTIKIIPSDNGKPIELESLGDGVKTLLLLSYFKAYADAFKNGSVIMIEEPELYLHPHMRRHLFDTLNDLMEKGVQVFYTTHSPDLVCIPSFENVAVVRKNESMGTTARWVKIKDINDGSSSDVLPKIKRNLVTMGITADPTEISVKSRLENFYRTDQNEAFFAKKIVLVEGTSEFFSIPIYAQAMGYSLNQRGISIIDCKGKDNIHYYYSIFQECFEIPTFVIVDGDILKSSGRKKTKNLNSLLSNLLNLELDESSEFSLNERGCFFRNDFEDFIKQNIGETEYQRLNNEAKQEYGRDSKWYTQKYIAKKITNLGFLEQTEYKNLRQLIQKICD